MLYQILIEQFNDVELLFSESEYEEATVMLQSIKKHISKHKGQKAKITLRPVDEGELEEEKRIHEELLASLRNDTKEETV